MSNVTPLHLARCAADWVSFQLHREALERFVPRGSRVLEVSAGVGDYTEALHRLGCKITVLDESLDELESNQARARARGFTDSIEGWAQGDICSLGGFAADSFDAVVAYGAALSYALDRRDRALSECMRVLRPRGVLVLDVFSLWGSMRRNLPEMLARDIVQNRAIIRSGNARVARGAPALQERTASHQARHQSPVRDATLAPSAPTPLEDEPSAPRHAEFLRAEAAHHPPAPDEPYSVGRPTPEPPPRERQCHLFRAVELEAFLRRAGLGMLSLSTSSALATGVEMRIGADPGTSSALLEYERAACVERGCLDSGLQLIAIARR